MSFYNELKRRNVFKVAIAYLIVGWLLMQVSDTLVPALRLPDWFHSGVAFVLILAFPLALIFAWAYEMTPDGLKKEKDIENRQPSTGVTGRKLDFVTIALLVVALGYFVLDKYKFGSDGNTDQTDSAGQTTQIDPAANAEPLDGKESIAVLPFVNMSSDPEQEYFSDGLSEELLNLLAKIPELRVISRSSAFAFKGEKIDIPVVAKKLNVKHVLEGSVRKSGNRIRITAQLIEAGSDTHLWSETYDRELDDIFVIQDEIAAEVVAQLRINLLGELPKSRQTDPQAYALFLQARHIVSISGGEDVYQKAEDMLRQALELEPAYTQAMTELAIVYWMRGKGGVMPEAEADKVVMALLDQAASISPDDPSVVSWQAWIVFEKFGDLQKTAALLQRALALDTSHNELRIGLVLSILSMLGRIDEAISYGRFRLARDPLCSPCSYALARTYRQAGQFDQAEKLIRQFQIFQPNSGKYSLAVTLLAKGEPASALSAVEDFQDGPHRTQGMALAMFDLGRLDEFASLMNELQSRWPKETWLVGEAYAWTGETDAAFEALEKNIADNHYLFFREYPRTLYRRIHSDPRWQAMLEKYDATPEQFAAIPFTMTLPE